MGKGMELLHFFKRREIFSCFFFFVPRDFVYESPVIETAGSCTSIWHKRPRRAAAGCRLGLETWKLFCSALGWRRFLPTKRQDGLWPNTKTQLLTSWRMNHCACSTAELAHPMAQGRAGPHDSLSPSPSSEEEYQTVLFTPFTSSRDHGT